MQVYYRILSITDDAGKDEIKKAFRRLAFQFHPDLNPGNQQQSESQFKIVKKAYDILIDENKRWQYDNVRTLLQQREQSSLDCDINSSQIDSFEQIIAEFYPMGPGLFHKCHRGFGKRCKWRDSL
jgi:DnaJ-class molecular chaperone